MIITLKEKEGDLGALLCRHNVTNLSIISLTTEDKNGKSVKSLLFNLLVPFVQWEGVGSIEGAERKSGRSGEEENQNTKFSA